MVGLAFIMYLAGQVVHSLLLDPDFMGGCVSCIVLFMKFILSLVFICIL